MAERFFIYVLVLLKLQRIALGTLPPEKMNDHWNPNHQV